MNKIFLILLLFVFSVICNGQTLISSTKKDYLNAIEKKAFVRDKNIKITKDKIVIDKKLTLKNNSTDENYCNYKYIGSFGHLLNLIFIEKEDYNGSTFFVLDKEKKYKKSNIQGKPFLFEGLIITINIENTTDNKNILSIYNLSKSLTFINKIDLKEDIVVKDLRVLRSEIYIIDINGKFWKMKFQ